MYPQGTRDQERSGCTGVTALRTKQPSRRTKSHCSIRQLPPAADPCCAGASWAPDGSFQRTILTELGTSARVREETAVPAWSTQSRRASPGGASV